MFDVAPFLFLAFTGFAFFEDNPFADIADAFAL
jgi:hypothetical protein